MTDKGMLTFFVRCHQVGISGLHLHVLKTGYIALFKPSVNSANQMITFASF